MTSAEGYKVFDNKSSFAKLLFLAVISIALCSFTPLTFLAPVPLTILALLYGRTTVIIVGAVSFAAIFGASSIINFPALMSLYAVSFVYALLISEVIYRGINPTTGLLAAGLSVFAITMGIFAAINFSKPMYIKSMMTELVSKSFEEVKVKNKKALDAGTTEAKELKEILEKPEKMVTDVYNNTPAIVFVGVFLGIWLSFFVTLRNARVWRYKVLYHFGLKDLLRFKVPEHVVFLLIIGLAVYLAADYGLGTQAEVFGSNILGCLAVLYFFQGFGIYNDYMAFLKMGPFLRMILTTFTVLFAWKMLVAVGVFDLWFNFRKFIKKQNGEGDKI